MAQRRVAELVAELIIDLFEMVEVAHQTGGGATERSW